MGPDAASAASQAFWPKDRYLSTVMERIKNRFPEEDVAKLEEMLDIISNELMPELDPTLSARSDL